MHDWWARSSKKLGQQIRQGFNSIIILGAWLLWNHCNRCVFDGGSPNIVSLLIAALEELNLWGIAGAKGIKLLTSSSLEAG
ncbi:hypothetical protein GQ55_4G035200 [Panicum hallii var. hallii]|uniref:Uncharacterized protein n=1 Tax=Panicum hallii var. hallii TaxID=1504633 RepID=A0A2T7DUW8_9POAL|nr:hypothetical protein GQ55_4G035200 [Panicum hallii var. hallii]